MHTPSLVHSTVLIMNSCPGLIRHASYLNALSLTTTLSAWYDFLSRIPEVCNAANKHKEHKRFFDGWLSFRASYCSLPALIFQKVQQNSHAKSQTTPADVSACPHASIELFPSRQISLKLFLQSALVIGSLDARPIVIIRQ